MFRTYSIVMTLALLLPGLAAARSGLAGAGGVVRDESGGVIPGASIRIVNEANNAAVDLFSGEQGAFRALSEVTVPSAAGTSPGADAAAPQS